MNNLYLFCYLCVANSKFTDALTIVFFFICNMSLNSEMIASDTMALCSMVDKSKLDWCTRETYGFDWFKKILC